MAAPLAITPQLLWLQLMYQLFFQVWRPTPGSGRPHPGEHPAPPGRGHAEADEHQGRHGGRVLDGHRALVLPDPNRTNYGCART